VYMFMHIMHAVMQTDLNLNFSYVHNYIGL